MFLLPNFIPSFQIGNTCLRTVWCHHFPCQAQQPPSLQAPTQPHPEAQGQQSPQHSLQTTDRQHSQGRATRQTIVWLRAVLHHPGGVTDVRTWIPSPGWSRPVATLEVSGHLRGLPQGIMCHFYGPRPSHIFLKNVPRVLVTTKLRRSKPCDHLTGTQP